MGFGVWGTGSGLRSDIANEKDELIEFVGYRISKGKFETFLGEKDCEGLRRVHTHTLCGKCDTDSER